MSNEWHSDPLLDDYLVHTIDLRQDPDSEDPIVASLVRPQTQPTAPTGAVLYVHGFTDYFFQTELADFYQQRGLAFYALDLRKCGRSLAEHHTPHYTSDLAFYDEELNAAVDVITDEVSALGGVPRVIVTAHSTGGLITALWLDRLAAADPERHGHVVGLVLNSPWLDLQGPAIIRTDLVTAVLFAIGSVRGKQPIPAGLSSAYGESLHSSAHGEWTYDLSRKPIGGFPATFGFVSAVRRGHRRVHDGIDVRVPALVLRSDKSVSATEYEPRVDSGDAVLDVHQIAQWSAGLSSRVTAVAVPDARHDIFLSVGPVRERAYAELDAWLAEELGISAETVAS